MYFTVTCEHQARPNTKVLEWVYMPRYGHFGTHFLWHWIYVFVLFFDTRSKSVVPLIHYTLIHREICYHTFITKRRAYMDFDILVILGYPHQLNFDLNICSQEFLSQLFSQFM